MLTDLIYIFFLSIFFAWSDNRIFCNCCGMLMYVCTIMASWCRHLTWGIMFHASTLCVQQIPLGQLSLTHSTFQVANFEEHPFLFIPSPSSPLLSDKQPWLTRSFHKQKTCLPLILQHRLDLCVWVNIHNILPDHALYHHLCCFLLQVTLHHVLYQCKCERPHPTKRTPSSPSTGASPAFTMSPGYTTSTLLCTPGEGTSSSSPPTLPLPLPPPLLILQML